MTQEPANGNVCILPSNNDICHQVRKVHSRGGVRWIAAALIAVVAFFGSVPANAQIGASLVTSINNDANLSSYSFPSATYSNDILYIAFTTSSCATSEGCTSGNVPTVTSVSGAGLTFTEIGTAGGFPFSGTNRRIQAWRALVTSGATTGVVTVTLGGTSYSMGAVIIAFTGTKTSGTNGADAVVQSATNTSTTTSLTVTLNAFASSDNRPLAFFAHRLNEATTNEAGYTELWDATNANTPIMAYEAECNTTVADTTPTASGWTTGYDNGGFALEIARADTSPLLTFNSKYVVTSSTAVTSTSSTLADDTQASQTFSLAATQTVLAIYNPSNNSGSTEIATGKQIAVSVDGADYANTWNSPYAANGADGATTFWIGTLAAGSHTIKGRFASNTNGSTVTIDERVLLILILNGNAYWYIDNNTTQTTTSNVTLVNDPSATQSFTPSGACKALILYNVGNAGATEDQNGKYAAINLGGTDYSKLIKSPNLSDRSDNVFTLHYAALTATSQTAQGRFASRFGATVTISRRQLGVLLFADTTLGDYVTSNTSVNTTSLYPVNDGQALISRTTTDTRELLVVATGGQDYQASSTTGLAYGIQVDGTDRTKSRTSPRNIANNSGNSTTAWAERLGAASHTVQGRYGNNAGSAATYVTSRQMVALWLPVPSKLLTFNSKYVVTSSTAVTNSTTTLADDTQASQTFSLAASQTVLVIYQANNVYGSSMPDQGMQNAISVDGADVAISWDSPFSSSQTVTRNTVFWIGTLGSGSHTIKGRLATNFSGYNATVSNRVLLIYILNGDAFRYVDSTTLSTNATTTLTNDPAATFTFTPPGSCKALILYNLANSGATEVGKGKKAAIRVGSTDYSQAEKSANTANAADSVFTLWALSLTAASTTVTGRFAANAAGTATINRRQLGVLMFDDSTLLDTVSSDTQVTTTSSTLVDDSQATITRNPTDALELLVVAMGTKRDNTISNNEGECYGIMVNGNDRANSRGSNSFQASQAGDGAGSEAAAWAETLSAGSHTIKGRFSNNLAGDTAKIDSRRIVALWFPSKFQYRRAITIDHTKVSPCSSNLSNFPILISESGNWLKTQPNGNIYNSSGHDIIFRASDGVTQLDHEIEKYDGTSGVLVAWVRIPTLSYTSPDTYIYMYYGNEEITSSTQNVTGVWNTSYGWQGVWHLSEATTANRLDSTNNGNTVTPSASQPTLITGGKIDGASNFVSASSQSLSIADVSQVGLDPTGDLTVEGWFRMTTSATGVIAAKDGTTTNQGYYIRYNVTNPHVDLLLYNGTQYTYSGTTQTLTLGTWYHAAGVLNTTTHLASVYLNGNLDMTPGSFTGTIVDNTAPFRIGARASTANWLNGDIDEVRVSSVARDACWIGTEYNSMNNPSGSFYTVGSEESPAPTAVKLTSFTATEYSGGVLLKWHTGYEVNNLGFHVYREENGQLVRLTPEPVAGSALLAGSRTALTAGHHYHWWDISALDTQPSSLATPKYWLQDIDLSGKRTMHGPVTPIISREALPHRVKPELLSERGWRLQERYHHYWRVQDLKEKLRQTSKVRGPLRVRSLRSGNKVPLRSGPTGLEGRGFHRQPSPSETAIQQYLAGRPAVKLLVREEGWYRVYQPELVAAGLSSKVNPKYLQLYAEGQEQPIRVIGKRDGVFGSGDTIEFYGVGLDTSSTDTRVYWLIEGTQPGKRIDNDIFNPPFRNPHSAIRNSFASFPHAVEIKDKWIYLPAIKNGEEENFFGAVVYGSGADQLLGVKHLDIAASEDALLEVELQGATSGPHRVKVLVNDEEVGEVVFESQSKGLLQVEVSQGVLHEGDNLVSFVPVGGEMDVSLVDSVRLTYWHTYTADDDGLRLTAQGGSHLTVNGFSHPKIRVIDITDSNDVIEVIGKVESLKGSYAISFRVPGHDQRTLLALTEEKVKTSEGITSNHPSSWHQVKEGYDLVILTHGDFFDTLQPLKKLRESQGLKVALIDVEDLYDEFSSGNKSPKAIKDFLASAKNKWRRAPRFVLLVGDASFDPRNYLGMGDLDFVPTKLIDTAYLETASDDWFVDLNSDGLPEMAVGRLPVQTVEEASTVVSKIVGYERSSKKNEALLVADRADNSDDFNFEGASEEIRGLLPSSLVVRKIYRSQFGSDSQANGVLLSAINQGPLLVNFIGHGSIEIWRGNILTSDDAEALVNGFRLPFFVNMTCLNGYFQDPYSETLGEALIKAKQGGAIAVWTSSGLTEPDKQAVMNKELIKLLFGRESLTLGEATAKAKKVVSDQDVRKTWILFGDPTTRLK